ncbi:diacylglycerol kinase family protein, partial [Gryllotalpicola sp.]|uniref:diacylglycerol/lipid kinase family protein n=1 Tax=Gryllotalpicola sp. TaxID=1932787 RepID=UPI002623F973
TAAAIARGLDEPLWFPTAAADAGAGAVREAVAARPSAILVAGGDGTVRIAAGELRHSGIPVGIVPSGTGNLLARALGVPVSSLPRAVTIAFDGAERTIDVGLMAVLEDGEPVAQHAFLVVAGIGIDAHMVANTQPLLKKHLGWLAYVEGGFRSLTTAKPSVVHYQVDGHREHSCTAHSVLVGNAGVMPGGLDLMPDVAVDDGMLDLAVLHPRSMFGWLFVWRTVAWENHVLRRSRFGRRIIQLREKNSPNVITYARGSGMRVTLDDKLPGELDGDLIGLVDEAVFRSDPGALLVRVPAPGREPPGRPRPRGKALNPGISDQDSLSRPATQARASRYTASE